MKVILFGATGMVGQGVLRECLLDSDVEKVLTVGRSASGVKSPKLSEIVQPDMFHYSEIESPLTGYDACFFCLGVTSVGMSEEQYERLTYTLTLAAAETLSRLNPGMIFVYVSGVGTDSTEKGRVMWARIKGKTENALLRLPFKAAYMFRPGAIVPIHGERSKTTLTRVAYSMAKPILPLLLRLFPRHILTTEEMGRAMLNVAKNGARQNILETWDIANCAKSQTAS